MGKLHKIRHNYNKLSQVEKESVLIYFTNGMQKGGFTEAVHSLVNFGRDQNEYVCPYKYYLQKLLREDGLIKKEKWTKRVSKLVSRNGNEYMF